jgi:hypothetical protein
MGSRFIGVFTLCMLATLSFAQFFSNRSSDPRVAALNGTLNSKSGVPAPVDGFWSELQNDVASTTISNANSGYAAYISGVTGAFRIADDFSVVNGKSFVTKVRFFAFETNRGVANPIAASVSVRIWSGRPGDSGATVISENPSAIFVENASFPVAASGTAVTSGNIYRIFNSAVPAPGLAPTSNRAVHEFIATLGSPLTLDVGTYWIDCQINPIVAGTVLAPLTTHEGFRAPQNPATIGNARHLSTTGWADMVDTGLPGPSPDLNMDIPFQLDGSCTLFPISYTILQGSYFGGNIVSLQNPDNNRLLVFCDEFTPNSLVEYEFDTMTAYSGTTYVGSLTINLESSSSRNDQVEFLRIRNHATSLFETIGNWLTTFPDTSHSATIVSATNYVSTSQRVVVRTFVIPSVDIDAGDGWSESYDLVNVVCGP